MEETKNRPQFPYQFPPGPLDRMGCMGKFNLHMGELDLPRFRAAAVLAFPRRERRTRPGHIVCNST